MTVYRFTTPITQTQDVAAIEAIIYRPQTGTLEAVFVTKDSGNNEVSKQSVNVAPIPAQAQTRLTELVTRLYTYLNAQGLIPNGTEE